jgi:hypothetical protein
MNLESLTSIRELDSRVGDGLHVRLWWDESSGNVWVSVLDTRSGDALTIAVAEGQRPLDVFLHPFAYAPREHAEALSAYAA